MILLTFISAIFAFAAFSLSTDEHYGKRLHGRLSLARKRQFRAAAWAGLALCFGFAIGARGWIFGPVLFFGVISFGAALIFLSLNFAPARKEGKGAKQPSGPSC